MKKASGKRLDDELRPEYDLRKLKGGVRGKYYRQAVAGTNLVLIEAVWHAKDCDIHRASAISSSAAANAATVASTSASL